MSYKAIKQRLDNNDIIILDGATGTELERRGAKMNPASWCGPASLENQGLLTDIHIDYLSAGSDIITANTFASSRLMLSGANFGDKVEEINRIAIDAALEAQKKFDDSREVAVAGSLSHMLPLIPGTDIVDKKLVPSESAMADAFHELAEIQKSSGVDLILLEMMYNSERIPHALEAALSTGLPVWFGMSVRRSNDNKVVCFDRHEDLPLDTILGLIPGDKIDVVGVMHSPSDVISDALQKIKKYFDGPLSAYPDSGYFESPNWNFNDIIEPHRLEDFFLDWFTNGARVLGGCCGLGVDHIKAAVSARDRFC